MKLPDRLWTDEERQTLRDNWANMTAKQIGNMIGRTRNAIIGAAARLGLAPKARSGGKPSQPKPTASPERITPFVTRGHSKPLTTSQPWPEKGILLLDATSHQCKAILGSSATGAATVCGRPVDTGSFFEFCPDHMKIYTQPARR